MKFVCSCGSVKFHKLGTVQVVEHGDFGKEDKWETEFTELTWDKYKFDFYICASCGKFLDDKSQEVKDTSPMFWHPV